MDFADRSPENHQPYEQVLNQAQEFQSDPHYEKELKKLMALLHRNGYVFEGTRLIPLAGIDLKALEAAPTGVDRASLRGHIRRIEQNVDADPAQAIGSAKEMVETVAKHVLVQFGEDHPDAFVRWNALECALS